MCAKRQPVLCLGAKLQEVQAVRQRLGRFLVDGLAYEESQLVGILTRCRHSDSALEGRRNSNIATHVIYSKVAHRVEVFRQSPHNNKAGADYLQASCSRGGRVYR